jgi:hypothetical protein
MEKISNKVEPKPETETSKPETRRAAIAKVALYGAYTAPVMLGMMTSAKAGICVVSSRCAD